MESVVRAFVGYLFLVFVVRVVGRRPGKQLTPFEYVLIFFIGGLALTAIVGDERSITSAVGQILVIGATHYILTWARSKSSRVALLIDGTPLILLEKSAWRSETMRKMRIEDDDVMFVGRDHELATFDDISSAILERNGDISVLADRSQPSKPSG